MKTTDRQNRLVTFFTILTAVLLCIAFFFALKIGFGNGLPDMGVNGLSSVCADLCRGIPFSFWPQITLLLMLIFLLLFFTAAGRWIDRADRKKLLIFLTILIAFLVIVQLVIVFGLNIIQNTDSFEVQDQAMAIAKGILPSVDYTKSAYFRKYGNNDLYLLTCIGIYRLCDALSISSWQKVFVLVNMLCVDAGIFLACDIVRILSDRRTALKACLVCVLNPMNYLLLHWTYTCTFSVPLMLLGIWIAVRMYARTPSLPVRAAGCAAIGFITVIGYYMRPTAVFPILALLLALLFQHLHAHRKSQSVQADRQRSASEEHRSRRNRKIYRKLLVLALTVVVMAGTAFSIRNLNTRYDPDSQTKFPIQHWIMIGIRGTGRVTGEDIRYTEKYDTQEEKAAADKAAIQEALQERGVGGTILHYVEKTGLTWSDGTSEYYQRTTQSENSRQTLYQLINGEYCGGLLLYCQAFRILLLLLAILAILRGLFHRKKDLFFTVFTFSVLGGFLFYIIWEGKPVYSYPFTFCLIILGCFGWIPVSESEQQTYRMHLPLLSAEREGALIRVTMAGTIILVAASVIGRGLYVAKGDVFSRPSIICDSKALAEWDSLHIGEAMTQEFYPAYPFNHIRVAAKKMDQGNGAYQVTLSSQGKTLETLPITRPDIHEGYLTLSFETIVPLKNQGFTLTITNENSETDAIQWGSRLCYITSEYKGMRAINGIEQVGDLLMRVYQD